MILSARQIRKQFPQAAKVFDFIVDKYQMRKHPWKPFYGSQANDPRIRMVRELDPNENHAYKDLKAYFHSQEFRKVCRTISRKSKSHFDAWGPYHLPEYHQFLNTLSPIEKENFLKQLGHEKERAIGYESNFFCWHGDIDFNRVMILLDRAKDARQQFRYLACLVEHQEKYSGYGSKITKQQWKRLQEIYEIELKRYAEIQDLKQSLPLILPRTPIKWKGSKADLICVLDSLKAAGLIELTDAEAIAHFDFPSKYESFQPKKRYSGTRTAIKKGDEKPNGKVMEGLISRIKSYLP